MDDLTGQMIRGYELREQIGAGGFGAVYQAYQPLVDREVAVKVILPRYANQPNFVRRFEVEAQVIARLEHLHIVPLYDFWREPEGAYLVMRWLPSNLRQEIAAGLVPINRILKVYEQVAAALNMAHRRRVVHRDLKPDNILLDDDRNTYLADFGIAKDLNERKIQDEEGAIIGSPAYLSPEQIKNGEVTPQSDIYSLGIMLHEMINGVQPFKMPSVSQVLQKHLFAPLPPLLERGDLSESAHKLLTETVQKATEKRPENRYSDVASFMVALREAITGQHIEEDYVGRLVQLHRHKRLNDEAPTAASADEITQVESTFMVSSTQITNPYKGLRAFHEADAGEFFGRDALVAQLLKRLDVPGAEGRFLAVVGPSGSGKSSVVHAGLIPALRSGVVHGSENWFITDMIPGSQPLEELVATLRSVAINPVEDLLGQLTKDINGLSRIIQQILPANSPDTELVLLINQFEEVFTMLEDEEDRALFLNSIAYAVNQPDSRVRVILTLRADFYDQPLYYAEFGNLLRRSTEVVLPLSPSELRQAIVSPAERIGVMLEPDLVAQIMKDVGEHIGALPLLQYSLTELFERRDGRTLTLAAYKEMGGVLGALARRADEIYDQLDEAGQELARQIFLRMITIGDGTDDTRRRVRRDELVTLTETSRLHIDKVINAFSKYRLLTFDRDPVTRAPTIEIAHEALISSWQILQDWIADTYIELRLQHLLNTEAAEWLNAERDPDYLAVGSRLQQFETLASEEKLALSEVEEEYLNASIAARKAEWSKEEMRRESQLKMAERVAHLARQADSAQRRAIQRLRYVVVALLFLLIVGAGLIAFALDSRGVALKISAENKALWLAAESSSVSRRDAGQLGILLALQSHSIGGYKPQADVALQEAIAANYLLQRFEGHTDAVNSVAFSPDGKFALSGSDDGTVQIWDVRSGKNVSLTLEHPSAVMALAISKDDRFILTGAADGAVRVWNRPTGELLLPFNDASDSITSVAFSADSAYFATASSDGYARVYDMDSQKKLFDLAAHADGVTGVAFSPDGALIATTSLDRTLRLWDAKTGLLLKTLGNNLNPRDRLYSVAFSPDGLRLVTGGYSNSVNIWDVESGEILRHLVGHYDIVNSVAFSSDGRFVASGSTDRTIRLWSSENGTEIKKYVEHTDVIRSVAFSPDGSELISASADRTVGIWNVNPSEFTTSSQHIYQHSSQVYALGFSPDNRFLLTGSQDGIVRFWDTSTHQVVKTSSDHTNAVWSVKYSQDGQYLATGSEDGTVLVRNAETLEILATLTHKAPIWGVDFSPDSKLIVTGTDDTILRVWDWSNGTLAMEKADIFQQAIYGVAFTSDGQRIVASSVDHTMRIFAVPSGEELTKQPMRHSDDIYNTTVSADGRYILSPGADQRVILWDAMTYQKVREFVGHTDIVWSVAFSPDSRYVLSGGQDQTVRLWNLETGVELRRIRVHNSAVTFVMFAPDGQSVVSSSFDGTVQWSWIDYNRLREIACQRIIHDLTDEERKTYDLTDSTPTCP